MITIDAIAELLDRNNVGYNFTSEKNALVIYAKLENAEDRPIGLRIIQNGEILEINAFALFKLNGKVFKNLLMENILKIQDSTPLLKFYLHTVENKDEWIGAAIDFPLPNRKLLNNSALECIEFLINSLDKNIPRLQHILDTGCEPTQKFTVE